MTIQKNYKKKSIKKPKKIKYQKKHLKKFLKTEKIIFLKCNFLVLPIEEIGLRPELSSPPCFRIQCGYPERDTGAGAGAAVVAGLLYFRFLI